MLANILRKVAGATASPGEATALNRFINALHYSMNPLPPRRNSVVIQFSDNRTDRFHIPEDFVITQSTDEEITLNFIIVGKFSTQTPQISLQPPKPPSCLAEIRIVKPPNVLVDALKAASQTTLKTSPTEMQRAFIQLRAIDQGVLLQAQKAEQAKAAKVAAGQKSKADELKKKGTSGQRECVIPMMRCCFT